MPQIAYTNKRFNPEAMYIIAHARQICSDYAAEGYDLTLRQVYYQFVARDLFPDERTWRQLESGKWIRDPNGTKNAEPNYKWLGIIINDARLAGYLDWDYIVDRTRNLRQNPHWDSPESIIRSAASGYAIDKWKDQDYRVEVWVEKDALVGVLEACCPDLDVPFFSCRGYTSQSEVWGAAQRLRGYLNDDKMVRVIHLGDHDPSGIDMTRDIEQRIAMFIAQDVDVLGAGEEPEEYVYALSEDAYGWESFEGAPFQVDRIALNWDQIQRYNPPPNPAKLSDSRGAGYVRRFGRSSWELDALEPRVLRALITDAVTSYRDEDLWQQAVTEEEHQREILTACEERWEEVAAFLENGDE